MPGGSPGALFSSWDQVCLLPCLRDWTRAKQWLPDLSSAIYWNLLEILGEHCMLVEICYYSFCQWTLKALQFTLLFEIVCQTSLKKKFSVGLSLCPSRVNIITRNYLSFFTANTLFSSSSPFAPPSSINSTDSLANFLSLGVSEDDFTVSFYASCSSKPFLACKWFYIYGLHLTYWCLD